VNPSKVAFTLCCAVIGCSSIALVGQQAGMKTDTGVAAHPHAHELNGFLLRQDRKAVEAALGKPFRDGKNSDGWHWCAYHLRGFKDNYLVAFYIENAESFFNGKVVQLELTGNEPSGLTGFYGLELGDSAKKAEAVLGKPSEIRHENDANVDLWDYKNSNYSLEFTPSHKLSSIQVDEGPVGREPAVGGTSEVYAFAKAVKMHDVDAMMYLASGEIECSKRNAFGIQGGKARKILDDRRSAVSLCLAQAADAILTLGPQLKSTDTDIRIWEKAPSGIVVKFPQSSPLREVVLMDEAGSPRIYEVTFR
jgi:hypothetical protein